MADKSVIRAIDAAIADYMSAENITQLQMAEKLNISPNTLRWKRAGKHDWSWSEILRISDMTGMSPNELAHYVSTSA